MDSIEIDLEVEVAQPIELTVSDVTAVEPPDPGANATWFGAIEPEFLYEAVFRAKLSDAANWPLTPSTTSQNLTWVTQYQPTANMNAAFDRYGLGYHGGEALDYSAYAYVYLSECHIDYAYNVEEESIAQPHALASGFEAVCHFGPRPRTASGQIIYPSAQNYGTYANTVASSLALLYKDARGDLVLANSASYGVSAGVIGPQHSANAVVADYTIFRTPSFGVRCHDSYMPVAAFAKLDPAQTELNYRCRLYRVPLEYGLYYMQNKRLVETLLLEHRFPTERI